MAAPSISRYQQILESIFFAHYKKGAKEVCFARDELVKAATRLKMDLPKNLGDVVYSVRYRTPLPKKILATQPKGKEWIIEGAGRAAYKFLLVTVNRILPNPQLAAIKIPDATPEIISEYALSDEQALLAKVRYNRLVDIFLGISTYSLQNHLRTTVSGIGQIEIDEIYVGVDRHGCQYVLPMQAKGGNDRLSVVQTKQDLLCCREKFPQLICRALSAQFLESDIIALFELMIESDEVKIVEERHYKLVPSSQISAEDLKQYSRRRA